MSLAIHGYLANDVLSDRSVGVLADLLFIGSQAVVFLSDGYRDIRVDVAHENLVLGIGAELMHDLLRIHVASVDARFLQLVRDSLRHVGEPLSHLVVEVGLLCVGR